MFFSFSQSTHSCLQYEMLGQHDNLMLWCKVLSIMVTLPGSKFGKIFITIPGNLHLSSLHGDHISLIQWLAVCIPRNDCQFQCEERISSFSSGVFISLERWERETPPLCLPELLMWYTLHLPMSYPNNNFCFSVSCIAKYFSSISISVSLCHLCKLLHWFCLFSSSETQFLTCFCSVLLTFGISGSLLINIVKELCRQFIFKKQFMHFSQNYHTFWIQTFHFLLESCKFTSFCHLFLHAENTWHGRINETQVSFVFSNTSNEEYFSDHL